MGLFYHLNYINATRRFFDAYRVCRWFIETDSYTLINSGRYSDEISLENYLEPYRNSVDFDFLLGLIYMNNAKFTKSVESFLECTKLSHGIWKY